MYQNFSTKDASAITFADLNNIIEQCTPDIQETMKLFHLQSKEMNKLFFDTCNYQEKLELLHKRLILLSCFQTEIERSIEMIKVSEMEVENEVGNLESDISHICSCKGIQDTFRRNTYDLAETINTRLSNIQEILDRIEKPTHSLTENTSFDIFTLILRTYLKKLENIEMNIYQMRDKLNHVSANEQIVLLLLNLKKNRCN